MKQLHVYTDHDNNVVFKVITNNSEEADKLFEKEIGNHPAKLPGVTDMIEFVKE